jgi:iron complex outermembrane receptor protein
MRQVTAVTVFAKQVWIKLIALIAFQGLLLAAHGQDATLIEVSGRVTDQSSQQPLPDVSVQVKGTVAGTITNKTGDFKLRTRTKLPFTLTFSSVGFKEQQFTVTSLGSNLEIAMVTQTILGSDVVVSASRVQESILKSPVAIEKLDIRAIKESPASKCPIQEVLISLIISALCNWWMEWICRPLH